MSEILRSIVVGFLMLIIAAMGASAQQARPGSIAEARSGCKVWNAEPKPNETIGWNGACANSLAQGSGVLQWFESGRATDAPTGEYLDRKLHGRGVFTWPNGTRYDGEWRDDKRHGRGVLTSANGDRYDGEWRDDQRHGRGVFTWANSDRYNGDWRDDKPNGSGTLRSNNGVYTGFWSNGCFSQGDRKAAVNATAAECGFR